MSHAKKRRRVRTNNEISGLWHRMEAEFVRTWNRVNARKKRRR